MAMDKILLSKRKHGESLFNLRNKIIEVYGYVYGLLIFGDFLSKNKDNKKLLKEVNTTIFF